MSEVDLQGRVWRTTDDWMWEVVDGGKARRNQVALLASGRCPFRWMARFQTRRALAKLRRKEKRRARAHKYPVEYIPAKDADDE